VRDGVAFGERFDRTPFLDEKSTVFGRTSHGIAPKTAVLEAILLLDGGV
jgi:hypothetical protein